MYLMQPYDDALQEILDRGIKKNDRTGVGCISVAGIQRKYDLTAGVFPFVTRRRLFPKSVFAELIWFLSGSTKNQDLERLGAKFWGQWCDENNPKYRALREKYGYEPGDFGPIYGWQLRHFGADYLMVRGFERLADFHEANPDLAIEDYEYAGLCSRSDTLVRANVAQKEGKLTADWFRQEARRETMRGFNQIGFMIDILKNDPFGSNGRRCMFSLWNPADLEKMALPPCHFHYQAIADGEGGLTGILTQRSNDFPVGVPYNIAFYSALTIMLAQQCGMKPREFIHNANDAHIYTNQIDQVKEYLARPSPPDSPRLTIKQAADIYSYGVSDFVMEDYNPFDKIDVPVAV